MIPSRAARPAALAALLAATVPAVLSPARAQAHADPLAGTSQRFEAAVAREDAAALADMFAEDAEILAPNGPRIQGREAIRAFIAGFVGQHLRVHDTVRLSRVDGALGYKSGDYVITDASGKALDHGKWIEVWHRDGGTWRMTADIWNSDVAVAGTAPPAPAEAPPAG